MTDHDQSVDDAVAEGVDDNVRPLRGARGASSHRPADAGVGESEGTGHEAVKQPFEQVVEQHGPTVLRVCRAVVGSHDAEDAWSETFIAAMRAYPDLPADANVEAWLVTIAHRKAIDITRAAKRRPLPVDELPETTPTSPRVAAASDPEGVLDGLDLWESVRRLPDKQRQAVAYHYVAGLPYAEIAEILGGTADAARRAAADGIKNLRKHHPGASTEGAES